jgi:hypothetical protein
LAELLGHFSGRFMPPIIGSWFDMSGRNYRADGCQFVWDSPEKVEVGANRELVELLSD